jgi:hypothetical protein
MEISKEILDNLIVLIIKADAVADALDEALGEEGSAREGFAYERAKEKLYSSIPVLKNAMDSYHKR